MANHEEFSIESLLGGAQLESTLSGVACETIASSAEIAAKFEAAFSVVYDGASEACSSTTLGAELGAIAVALQTSRFTDGYGSAYTQEEVVARAFEVYSNIEVDGRTLVRSVRFATDDIGSHGVRTPNARFKFDTITPVPHLLGQLGVVDNPGIEVARQAGHIYGGQAFEAAIRVLGVIDPSQLRAVNPVDYAHYERIDR